ncbi:MAG: hypothetical protein QOD27_787, partial [Microbacteriaceae bacterium]|nr:hypothetical protein [Microbacteriaceae bacterium]
MASTRMRGKSTAETRQLALTLLVAG